MALWLILGAMTAVALALVLRPLLRAPQVPAARRDYELSVYRAQLAELEREQTRGLLTPEQAEAARLEVQRRMLAVDADPAKSGMQMERSPAKTLALALLVLVPAASGALYWWLGSPSLPGQPFAGRAAERQAIAAREATPAGPEVPSVATMIARLEQRLAEKPGDVEGWLRLGRARELMQDPAGAAEAYGKALALEDGIAELHAAYAEALVQAAGGTVTEKAQAAIERALELEPDNVRARFLSGLTAVQRGAREQALEIWNRLIADTPGDAPYLGMLQRQARALAEDLGLDPTTAVPAPAAEVTTFETGPQRLPEEQQALRAEARQLRQRLEVEPEDWQGWIRLARVEAALGEGDAAEATLAQGAEVHAGARFVQQQFLAAATELGVAAPGTIKGARGPTADQMRAAADMTPEEREEMIRGMVEGLAARLEEQPDDLDGWLMLARSYGVIGEPGRSADAYRRALALLPEGSPERAEVEAIIERLAVGG